MAIHSDYFIVMDRDKVDLELLRTADTSLPRVMRNMTACIPFVGLKGSTPISVCLVEHKDGYSEIENIAVHHDYQGQGYGRELLQYVMEYVRSQSVRYLDTGCGNADIRLYIMLQRAGFRVVGAWPDYYLGDGSATAVINAIVNRDMVRFRADLLEKKLATTGYDASGRTN